MTMSAARSSCPWSAAARASPRSCPSRICTPSRRTRICEFGDGVLNNLSYELARQFNVPVKGVYVANPGYALGAAGIARGSVIVAMNAKPVNNLDDLQKILDTLGDGARATVRYFSLDDPRSTQLRSFRMDRRWFLSGRCRRDDHVGLWNCADLPAVAPAPPPAPAATPLPDLCGSAAEEAHPLAGVRHLRHAVLGIRRHRDQLPWHRTGGRCGARPGGRGSQYRAGIRGRCADHLRGNPAGARARGVCESAAQSFGGGL